MNDRLIKMFQILAKENDFVSTEKLCMLLDIKPRTLREDIRKNRDYIEKESSASIESKPNFGYRLVIQDDEKFYNFMQELLYDNTMQQVLMPVVQKDRVSFIIRYFLVHKKYISNDYLADLLYISKSTLSADLKLVRDELMIFDLELESKPGYGNKIVGNELKIRLCMSHYFFIADNHDLKYIEGNRIPLFDKQNQNRVSKILYHNIKKENFKITDFGFQNLVVHLLIAVYRIQNKTYIDEVTADLPLNTDAKVLNLAKSIAMEINEAFNIFMPQNEINYIAIHLEGKHSLDEGDTQYVKAETLALSKAIFKEINNQYAIDFNTDINLFTMLSLHLQPMISRLKYGMKFQNPLLAKIQNNNPFAYELAVVAGNVISDALGETISEEEIGYIALHLELALSRKQEENKHNFLVVCASGAGTSRILLQRIQTLFGDSINNIEVRSVFELEHSGYDGYDLILSTVPLNINVTIPVIYVNYYLDEDDVISVKDAMILESLEHCEILPFFDNKLFFSNMTLESEKQVIKFMCQELKLVYDTPENFQEMVFQREKLSTTSMGNGVAIPHPTRLVMKESHIVVCHLRKPIVWGSKHVDIVLLLALGKDESESLTFLNYVLSEFIGDNRSLNKIRANPNFENFIEIIESLSKSFDNSETIDIFA